MIKQMLSGVADTRYYNPVKAELLLCFEVLTSSPTLKGFWCLCLFYPVLVITVVLCSCYAPVAVISHRARCIYILSFCCLTYFQSTQELFPFVSCMFFLVNDLSSTFIWIICSWIIWLQMLSSSLSAGLPHALITQSWPRLSVIKPCPFGFINCVWVLHYMIL